MKLKESKKTLQTKLSCLNCEKST